VTRTSKALAVAAVVALATALGVGAWLLTRGHGEAPPEISAYSLGRMTRVGPYRYCSVLDLTDCQNAQTQGELHVNSHEPVQLSVPPAIGKAPWWLLTVYEDSVVPSTTFYRPGERSAVTIPTVDPKHGRLTGIAVQLMTLVADRNGELQGVPHAEWSVRTDWS
jgi:hypothetical protein